MHGSGTTQSTVEDALKTLAYKAELNDVLIDDLDVDLDSRSLAYSVPRYEDDIPRGHTGVTVTSQTPGVNSIDTVYTESETVELYNAVTNRAKWFTRAYITPGQSNHIVFFSETTCMYSMYSQNVRVPGVIRGPDAPQGFLLDSVAPLVTTDTYLVPVHLLPDRYWERTQKCSDCRLPLLDGTDKPWIPRTDTDTDAYTCPECGTKTKGPVGGVSGNYFLHDNTTGTESQPNRCGPVADSERYKYLDWLLDIEPGATMQTPSNFPTEPTTLSDGTVVDWLSPLEPVTDLTNDFVPGVRPFITVHPPEHTHPFVIHQADVSKLLNAIKQQREDTDAVNRLGVKP